MVTTDPPLATTFTCWVKISPFSSWSDGRPDMVMVFSTTSLTMDFCGWTLSSVISRFSAPGVSAVSFITMTLPG